MTTSAAEDSVRYWHPDIYIGLKSIEKIKEIGPPPVKVRILNKGNIKNASCEISIRFSSNFAHPNIFRTTLSDTSPTLQNNEI